MIQSFLSSIAVWAENTPDVEALLVVGSCARGTNRTDSDVDLMVLTPNQMDYVAQHAFAAGFGEIEHEQTEDWGACQSVRVFYRGGLEVEYGFVLPSWLDIPMDSGTKAILQDGYRFLVDKKDYAQRVKAVL